MSNAHYWKNKEELGNKANQHTIEMREQYSEEIAECIKNSIIWSADDKLSNITFEQDGEVKKADLDIYDKAKTDLVSFQVTQNTTDGALMKSPDERITILNFASYKNPGGGFLKGSSAQEESLCHSSYLYNVLRELSKYYEWNNEHLNKGLYTNRAIYTYNVRFFDDNGESRVADVITCAAPNKSLLYKYNAFTEKENNRALESRINFLKILAYLSNPNIENIILGAWGCGVFKQDPVMVCKLFTLAFINSTYDMVTYAIPDDKTYRVFNETLRGSSK